MGIPSGWELVLLLAVLVLLFGSAKLPAAARSIGQSMRIFKAETRGMRSEDEATAPTSQQPATPHPPASPHSPTSPPQSLPPSGPAATPAQESQRHNDTTR